VTDKQPRLLTPRQRWLRGTVGVGLILLFPSSQFVPFYWETEDAFRRAPELIRKLEQLPATIERSPIKCGRRIRSECGPLYDFLSDVGASFRACSVDFPDVLWKLDLELTRPYRELSRVLSDGYNHVCSHRCEGPWDECNEAPPDKVPELEAKMAAVAKRHAAKLRSYLPRVRDLAVEHERMRPVLAGLAWTLLLIEIAGGLSLLALGWGWMIRRGRERQPPPREDPHWRTTEAGEQAPRTSPWFIALILLGALGTTALMMLAQRC
jgi:hypothetical protein